MIVDVHREMPSIKRDVERTARALTSATAVRVLRCTFEDACVIPIAGTRRRDASANGLADAIAAEPAESFETIRFRGACEHALRMLDREHVRLGRHASILLGLFVLGLLATLTIVILGFFWRATTTHVSAAVVCLASAGAIGVWYSYVSRQTERLRVDVRGLSHVASLSREASRV